MTPEERQLIADLFDRMRSFGAPEKDREAETFIAQSLRANPDAPYMLVQSVLVQEQALQAANNRVMELEEQLRATGDNGARGARSGGFLGGFWGGGRGEAPRSSVPQIGSRSTPSAYDGGRPASAWGQGGAQPQGQPGAQQAGAGGGSFMKSALATAAGVAGGMLLADSIRSMMTGGAQASPAGGSHHEAADAKYVDENDNDPGTYDAANDPGFDSGGGDLDI